MLLLLYYVFHSKFPRSKVVPKIWLQFAEMRQRQTTKQLTNSTQTWILRELEQVETDSRRLHRQFRKTEAANKLCTIYRKQRQRFFAASSSVCSIWSDRPFHNFRASKSVDYQTL